MKTGILQLLAAISLFIFPVIAEAIVMDRGVPPELNGGELRLSLRESVELAIKRNLSVILERYKEEKSLEKVTEEKGIFDPVFRINVDKIRQKLPLADIQYPRGFYSEEISKEGLGIGGMILTGARYGVELYFEKNESTSQVQTLNPKYSSRLNFSLTQPLLKDFGVSTTKTRIRVAEKEMRAARYDVKDSVIRTVGLVENAYWTILYAIENLKVQRESLGLANEVVKIAEVKVAAGEIAPVSLIEAKAGAAEREENVIIAEGDLKKAEYDLKSLLDLPDDSGRIYPHEFPEFTKTDVPLVKECINTAYNNRADLRAFEYRVEQKKIEERFANNQRLPRFDLVAEYGQRGIAGLPSEVIGADGRPLGVRVKGTPFEGKTEWEDVFDEYFKDEGYKSWTLGLRLEIPLGGREASAKYRQAALDRSSFELQMVMLKEKISSNVKKAVLDIQTSLKRIEAAKTARELAQEQLNIEKRKLDVGETSFYEFLRSERDLAEAKNRELKAFIDYNIARSKLRVEEGISLDHYGIEFDAG